MTHLRSIPTAPQDSRDIGVFIGMEGHVGDEGPSLAVYESVRCLECGAVYAKPTRGGTAKANPGCPECGYVGWLAVNVPFPTGSLRRRYAVDPPLGRSAQSH